jgi:hypothetical protein
MPSRKSKTKVKSAPPAEQPEARKQGTSASKPRRRRFRDIRQFVDAVFAENDAVAAAAKLLGKERFLEKLIELRFGKAASSPESANNARRIVFNMPAPAREREPEVRRSRRITKD